MGQNMLRHRIFSTSAAPALPRKSRLSRFFDVLHYAAVGVLASGTVFLSANLVSVIRGRRRHLREAEERAKLHQLTENK